MYYGGTMKSNIIKYIFIIFVIGIIGYAIYEIYYKQDTLAENKIENEAETQTEILTNMRLGIANFDNINPIISKNRDVINLSTIIYEPLMTLSEDYHLELALAKECSRINDKTYIVTLKNDLKWEDGSSITGRDVQFTVEKLKEGKSIYSDNVKNVSSVEIIDGQTVRINLSKEENFFEYNLIFPIISSTQFSKEQDFFSSRIAPMSSGMYKVKTATSTTMELVQNANWHGATETSRKIDSIQINFYSTMGDAYNSFKIGNIDMLCTSNVNIKDYIGTIGYTNKDYKGRELDFISLNCKDTILENKEVRQAIDYAINKKKIISSVYSNEYYLSSFPIDYGNYLYPKESTSHYSQEKAKKVLEDNGWTYKYGRWQKTENYSTKTIRLTLVVERSNEERVKVAELIEEQLEDIGISVSLNKVSDKNYQNYLSKKNYDMIITGIYNGYSPDLSYFLGDENIANYENEEIKTILNDLQTITDEETIQQKYQRIIEIYEEEVPYICLYRNKGKVIYSMKLTGEFNPTNYTAYYHLEKWYRQ